MELFVLDQPDQLDQSGPIGDPTPVDVLDLDAALTELAALDRRKSRIAELRFIGGLTKGETADALGISVATVERDWLVARAWLVGRLTTGRTDDT